MGDFDHRPNQWPWGVILAPITARISHPLDLLFIENGQLVLGILRAEFELINVIDDLPQVIAALNLVLDLPKDLSDLVVDGVGRGCPQFELFKVWKELSIHKVTKVIPGHGLVMVQLPVGILRRGPGGPSIGFTQKVFVSPAFKDGDGCFVLLDPVQVFQEEEPGGLLRIIQFGTASTFLVEDVIDVFEGEFEHKS